MKACKWKNITDNSLMTLHATERMSRILTVDYRQYWILTVLSCPCRWCEHNCRQDKTVLSYLEPLSNLQMFPWPAKALTLSQPVKACMLVPGVICWAYDRLTWRTIDWLSRLNRCQSTDWLEYTWSTCQPTSDKNMCISTTVSRYKMRVLFVKV